MKRKQLVTDARDSCTLWDAERRRAFLGLCPDDERHGRPFACFSFIHFRDLRHSADNAPRAVKAVCVGTENSALRRGDQAVFWIDDMQRMGRRA